MEVRLQGKKNIYEEIVEEFARYIRLGVLREGEKLPSCRALAIQLGINPNTVERAYSELEEQGLIRTFPKKGVFVHIRPDATEHALEETKRHLREIRSAGLSKETVVALLDEIYSES